jgi:hypothetical protein
MERFLHQSMLAAIALITAATIWILFYLLFLFE